MENIDNYKVVIITGKNDKSEDRDGEVIFVGPLSDYSFHIDCLLDYARRRYPDVRAFQQMNDRCIINVPIFFLTWLNSIVYINISSEKTGKRGILYMPDEVSEIQKKQLLKLAQSISNAYVDIVYDMDFDDGEVQEEDFKNKKGKKFYALLSDFLNKNEKKPRI